MTGWAAAIRSSGRRRPKAALPPTSRYRRRGFRCAGGDHLAVNPIDADGNAANGDTAFTFIGTGAFTAAGQINTFTDGFDTYILLNTDADASQEMTIRVLGVHNVDASWFVL